MDVLPLWMEGQSAANWAQFVIGVIALIAALKSAYNGVFRQMYDWLRTVEELEERIQLVEKNQKELIDVTIALSRSDKSDDVEVDVYQIRKKFNRVDSSRYYIDAGSTDGEGDTRFGTRKGEGQSSDD